jgi:hypothetical protein
MTTPDICMPKTIFVGAGHWVRHLPEVGTLTSQGVLRLSTACAMACGHHLVEGAEVDERARAARERVRRAAQQAADELGTTVLVTGTWDGHDIWTVHATSPTSGPPPERGAKDVPDPPPHREPRSEWP